MINEGRIDILMSQGRYDMAYDMIKNALAEEPNNPKALQWIALCCLNLKRYDEALEYINSSIRMEPYNGLNYYLKANYFFLKNRSSEALEEISIAIEKDSNHSTFHEMKSRILYEAQRYAEAEQSAITSLQLDSQNLDAANALSRALQAQNKKKEAAEVMDKVLELNPQNWETHANYGYAALEAGQAQKAVEHFRNALLNDPTSGYAQHGMKLAMKAKFPLYRWLLQFQLFMAKKGKQYNFAVIIGIILLMNVIRRAKDSTDGLLSTLLSVGLLLLVLFVFSTWILDPIMTFVLFSQKNGRLSLNESEKNLAIFVGIQVGLMILGLTCWLLFSNIIYASFIGIGFMGLLTSTNIFLTEEKRTRLIAFGFYGICSLFLLLFLATEWVNPGSGGMYLSVGLFSGVAYTWVGNGLFSRG